MSYNIFNKPELNFHLNGNFIHPTHAIVPQCDNCTNPGMKYCKTCKMRFCFECRYDVNPNNKKTIWEFHKLICHENIMERFKISRNLIVSNKSKNMYTILRIKNDNDNFGSLIIRSKHDKPKCIFCGEKTHKDMLACDFCSYSYCSTSYTIYNNCAKLRKIFINKYSSWRFYVNFTIPDDIIMYMLPLLIKLENICFIHK